MNIKLNARLSAYSKVDSIPAGGCNAEPVTNEEIDTLFTDNVIVPPADDSDPTLVSCADIDSLFN